MVEHLAKLAAIHPSATCRAAIKMLCFIFGALALPSDEPSHHEHRPHESDDHTYADEQIKTWICNRMARAARPTSLNVVSPSKPSEPMSRPTRTAPGTSSRRISNRFATNSPAKKLMPVTLAPGLATLVMRPSLTGSWLRIKTMGIVVVAA